MPDIADIIYKIIRYILQILQNYYIVNIKYITEITKNLCEIFYIVSQFFSA